MRRYEFWPLTRRGWLVATLALGAIAALGALVLAPRADTTRVRADSDQWRADAG